MANVCFNNDTTTGFGVSLIHLDPFPWHWLLSYPNKLPFACWFIFGFSSSGWLLLLLLFCGKATSSHWSLTLYIMTLCKWLLWDLESNLPPKSLKSSRICVRQWNLLSYSLTAIPTALQLQMLFYWRCSNMLKTLDGHTHTHTHTPQSK